MLYRPTIPDEETGEACDCKKFYTGSNERLLRVTPANDFKTIGRAKVVHLVSYEKLNQFLWQLLMGGDKLDAFLKAENYMKSVFFGDEKSSFHRNIYFPRHSKFPCRLCNFLTSQTFVLSAHRS